MIDIVSIMRHSPVIPVVTIDDVDTAVAIATELHAGGINVIEITRRTAVAAEALHAVKNAVPEMCVGMGTVWEPTQVHEAIAAGAEFIVSPGVADAVGEACRSIGVPYLPGAQTVSEAAHLARFDFTVAKLFPASVIGGPAAIAAYASVLPHMLFCPTGGISEETAGDYLALPNVVCVGGSWLTKAATVPDSDTSPVRVAAERAARLG
jgi:2-dehydro-3-deoxyphosphogluconate aldolase/(4S)-4-hydroxy-2-oxoglutarate aldolase